MKSHQPFYAQVNFSETHRGAAWNEAHRFIDRPADPERVQLPPYYPDHPVTRAVWAQYLNAVMAADKKVAFIRQLLVRDELADNTIVVFMSDHGRAMPRGKQWPYDSGLHIPLIVYWPTNADIPPPVGYRRATRSGQLVASIDVTATTVAIAGGQKPDRMQGRVLWGADADPPRKYLFGGRDRGDETVFHIRTVRDDRYRYLRNKYPERPFLQLNRYKEASYPIIALMRHLHEQGKLAGPPARLLEPRRPAEELYDLKSDPWEINNLAVDPEYSDVRARLSDQLDAWMVRSNDQGRTPEPPAVIAYWERQMKQNYERRLSQRPADWYLDSPVLGPYRQWVREQLAQESQSDGS